MKQICAMTRNDRDRRVRCVYLTVLRLLLATTAVLDSDSVFADTLSQAPVESGTEASNPSAHWTLDRLVEKLKLSNPQLEQARQAYVAAKLQIPQADALPGAQLGLLEQANTGGSFDFNRNSGFFAYPSITQALPWPGKLHLAGEIAAAEAEVAGRQYDSLEIQLISQLKLSVYQLKALQDQLHFMDEDLQRLEQIKDLSKVRYANNAAAYVDFLNAQVSASSLENDRFAVDRQLRQQIEQVNNLIGQPSQTPLLIDDVSSTDPKLPVRSLAELIDVARKLNPAIAGGESQITAADRNIELAHKAFMPDLAVSAGIYTDPTLVHVETTRMYSLGINLSLPSWGFRKEKAGLDQAKALLEEAKASQSSTLLQVDVNVASAYHGLETALQQLKFTRERLLPQAQMAYRLAQSGYSSNGGSTFSDLLTAQSSLRNTEVSLVQAENSAMQSYISLAAAIGADPEQVSQ